MDQRRFLLAIVLSVAVLLIYQGLAAKWYPVTEQPTSRPTATPTLTAPVSTETPSARVPFAPETIHMLRGEQLVAEVSAAGGAVARLVDPVHKDPQTELPITLVNLGHAPGAMAIQVVDAHGQLIHHWDHPYSIGTVSTNQISFNTLLENELQISKDFTVSETQPVFHVELSFTNRSKSPWKGSYRLIAITGFSEDDHIYPSNRRVKNQLVNIVDHRYLTSVASRMKTSKESVGSADLVSIHGRYFGFIVQPDQPSSRLIELLNEQHQPEAILEYVLSIEPGQTITHHYLCYAGPHGYDHLARIGQGVELAAKMGWMAWLGVLMLRGLNLLSYLVHNYGVAIILFTMLINLTLYPLNRASFSSMAKMQTLQPKVEQLKNQYKDNPEKMNREMLQLYKTHRVNPLGGCLPMLLQLPVFFALYQMLSTSIELRGSGFLWIRDLAASDHLWKLPLTLPLFGEYFNLLPLLMMGAMVLQQKLSPMKATSTPGMPNMTVLMPVLFGLMFYNLPSGLVLYWLVNSLMMILLMTLYQPGKVRTA